MHDHSFAKTRVLKVWAHYLNSSTFISSIEVILSDNSIGCASSCCPRICLFDFFEIVVLNINQTLIAGQEIFEITAG